MKVYIAGPMSGIPLGNIPAFDDAASRWQRAGWEVVNPAEITRQLWLKQFHREFDPTSHDDTVGVGTDIYRQLLRIDMQELATSDAIALLGGWENSNGARLEAFVAKQLGLRFFRAETMGKIDTPELRLTVEEPAHV